jgi:two-component system, chemotaxis family, protein-glutamate methylesterase/glutaminase
VPRRDIIVIGASAGGIEALKELTAALPAELAASMFVTVHVSPSGPGVLPRILSRSGPLPAIHPVDLQPIEAARVYVAPPDHHLLVKDGYVRVVRGPKENAHRPAVDPLFRSAAVAYGPRVIGVVLTGALDDGTAGLAAVKSRGGLAVVQDPFDALHPSMPQSAIRSVQVDHRVRLAELGPLLVTLASQEAPAEEAYPLDPDLASEAAVAEMEVTTDTDMNERGRPSVFTCPECQGTLWELSEGEVMRYRCRVGHAYSPETLLAERTTSTEAALWAAIRMLEESTSLSRRLSERARFRAQKDLAGRFEAKARSSDTHAETLRQILATEDRPTEVETVE